MSNNPADYAKAGTEEAEQTAFFCWLAINSTHTPELLYAFAVPNGGARGDDPRLQAIRGNKLKAQGVRAGVPDTCFPVIRFVDNKWWPGMWIELKKLKGGKTDDADQLRWAEFLKAQGYAWYMCRGWLAAREPVKWYFGQNRPWRDSL